MKPGSSSSPDRGKRQKLSDVADHSNASAISDVVVHTEHGKYGSVTKEIEDLVAIKMQILGPYFAKYPGLVNEFMNVVTDHDKDTGLTYHNVIDLTEENIEKNVHAATVIHIDSDVEDDGDKKAIVPFHEALKVEDDIHNKSIVPSHEASEEEDYRQNKSIAQFEEIVLPLVAPSPVVTKTVVSFS